MLEESGKQQNDQPVMFLRKLLKKWRKEKKLNKGNSMFCVGQDFPDFFLSGVDENNELVNISRCCLEDQWSVIYFYPKDFTFICPTEIAEMDRLVDEGAEVLGISGDNEFCKLNWKESNTLIGDIKHTLAADCGLFLADELGVLDTKEGVCLRATFIVDPEGVIQHVSVNALDTGRNVNEIIRTLKALQAGGLTGCAWEPGDDFVA